MKISVSILAFAGAASAWDPYGGYRPVTFSPDKPVTSSSTPSEATHSVYTPPLYTPVPQSAYTQTTSLAYTPVPLPEYSTGSAVYSSFGSSSALNYSSVVPSSTPVDTPVSPSTYGTGYQVDASLVATTRGYTPAVSSVDLPPPFTSSTVSEVYSSFTPPVYITGYTVSSSVDNYTSMASSSTPYTASTSVYTPPYYPSAAIPAYSEKPVHYSKINTTYTHPYYGCNNSSATPRPTSPIDTPILAPSGYSVVTPFDYSSVPLPSIYTSLPPPLVYSSGVPQFSNRTSVVTLTVDSSDVPPIVLSSTPIPPIYTSGPPPPVSSLVVPPFASYLSVVPTPVCSSDVSTPVYPSGVYPSYYSGLSPPYSSGAPPLYPSGVLPYSSDVSPPYSAGESLSYSSGVPLPYTSGVPYSSGVPTPVYSSDVAVSAQTTSVPISPIPDPSPPPVETPSSLQTSYILVSTYLSNGAATPLPVAPSALPTSALPPFSIPKPYESKPPVYGTKVPIPPVSPGGSTGPAPPLIPVYSSVALSPEPVGSYDPFSTPSASAPTASFPASSLVAVVPSPKPAGSNAPAPAPAHSALVASIAPSPFTIAPATPEFSDAGGMNKPLMSFVAGAVVLVMVLLA